MNTRSIIISVTAAALIVLAFLGGKMSQGQQTGRLKPSAPPSVSSGGERLKLIYPKNEAGDRTAGAPAKNFVVRRSGPAHMSSIERLSQKLSGIDLSPEQIGQMQDVYNVMFEARQKYELSNARFRKTGKSTVIEIPSYEVFGGQLRTTLITAFESILGKEKTKAIDSQIGTQIDVENTYWGKYPQVIQADYEPSNKRFRITRAINPTPEDPDAFRQEYDSDLTIGNLDEFSVFGELLAPGK